MYNISNIDFLKVIFGDDYLWAHVTGFNFDPLNIPDDKRGIAWGGGYFKDYVFDPFMPSNQFFTVSLFDRQKTKKSVRQKALFKSCHLVLLDDVKEKLDYEVALTLPEPTYILETSIGSEQWGYVLDTPCTSRHIIDNLIDGLIESGLAPDTKDPGMKGVTRYCRLPEGYNNKSSKLVDGKPFKCRITSWNPERKVSIEAIASTFNIDIHASRRDEVVEGASDIPDHPLLKAGLNIKKTLSKGRFDITCPWVEDHTKQASGAVTDNGTAIFTNEDGSLGFKCHHGHCENKTGADLMRYIEKIKPGFSGEYMQWRMLHLFKDIPQSPDTIVKDSMNTSVETQSHMLTAIERIKNEPPSSPEFNKMVELFLQSIDSLPEIEKHGYHQELCDSIGWSRAPLLE